MMVINPIGSTQGIFKSCYAFWLVLPLSLLCVKDLGKRTENAFIKYLSSFIPVILLLMLILAIFFHGVNVYRDDPNRLHLTSSFRSPQLIGTYSSADRVKVTDELMSVIENQTTPGDYLLMINSMPMFYYLTQTRPALKNPWLSPSPNALIIALEEEREQKGENQPKLFIYSKINTRDKNWPHSTPGEIYPEDVQNLNYLKERYIEHLNYTLLWENNAFAVYKEPISKNY